MASFLDNVVLEDFDYILEGEQAEAYKKRKREEKAWDDFKAMERDDRRTAKNSNLLSKARHEKLSDDEREHVKKQFRNLGHSKTGKEVGLKLVQGTGTRRDAITLNDTLDAMDRHDRRHPQKESTFFDDVNLI